MTANATYSQVQDQFTELCQSMTSEQAKGIVPTCPDWTPTDVLAHLVGLCADLDAGTRKGLGSDESTTAQVAARADLSVADILAEWDGLRSSMSEIFTKEIDLGWALVADLVTHDLDVRLSLGLSNHRKGPAVTNAARLYATLLSGRTAASDLPTVNVIVEGKACGPPNAPVTLSCSAFDILRAATGRRSPAQIASLNWTADYKPYLPLMSIYGPLPTEDIIE